jgi:uncharacterized RDD family membrane protein YckC
MADQPTGSAGEGPPSFPGNAPPPPPVSAPPPPPPQSGPPSYPMAPNGGYPPPPQGTYPPPYYGGPGAPGGVVPYAGWGTRLGGWLIDAVILFVVQAILGRLFRHVNSLTLHMSSTRNGVVHHTTFSFIALGVTTLVAIAYTTILCGGPGGQTVGMLAVGVRVVRDDTHGALGYGLALGRSVVEQLFRYTVVVWLVDMLFPLWDKKRQTLHDKIVRSVVIRVRNVL